MKWLCVLMAAMLAMPVQAQCRLCAPTPGLPPTKMPAKPLQMDIEASLDLGRAAHRGATTSGTVSIDPVTGARQVTGGLTDLGGMSLKGTVRLSGDPLMPVSISLPNKISLAGTDGSTAEVVEIKTDLSPNAVLDSQGNLTFAFGGRLIITAGQAGDFRGRISINAEYR